MAASAVVDVDVEEDEADEVEDANDNAGGHALSDATAADP